MRPRDRRCVPLKCYSQFEVSLASVSTDYFCNLDANLLRLDHLQRPELNKGTVDFDVTDSEDYWAQNPPPHIAQPFASVEGPPKGPRKPLALHYLFAFDVSHEAVVSGFLRNACDALKTILCGSTTADGVSVPSAISPSNRISIMTFDKSLHFYDLLVRFNSSILLVAPLIHANQSETARMMVVADLEEVFVPSTSLFVDPIERR